MSFQAMTWAVQQDCGSAPAKLILLMLANDTNSNTGRCDPSHKTLAVQCNMSISTVKNNIKKLEEMGFLTIIHRSNEGVNLPNQYQLNMLSSRSLGDGVGQEITEGGAGDNRGVGQEMATNQEYKPGNKTIRKKIPKKENSTDSLLTELGIVDDLARDFKKHRFRLRAEITETAMRGFQREAMRAGISVAEAVTISIERGWRGFNAEWVSNGNNGGINAANRQNRPESRWQHSQRIGRAIDAEFRRHWGNVDICPV